MPAPKTLTNALRDEYEMLFSKMSIRTNRMPDLLSIWKKILANSARYKIVEIGTGVPWFVIAIIHNLEASLRFDRHLHNGDSLAARTVRVPVGYPKAGLPPFKWEESAIDALGRKKVNGWKDWSAAGIAFILERYNGWGYRNNHPEVKSPYLWSFSSIYANGKYIADSMFSNEAVSQQCGGMTLLRFMIDQDQEIRAMVDFNPVQQEESDEGTGSFPHSDPAEDVANEVSTQDTAPSPLRPPGPKFPGRYLLQSSSGESVKRVKQQLKLFGCDPGSDNANFDEATKFAVLLFQARSVDQTGEPLDLDGVVGPLTWSALFGPRGDDLHTLVQSTPPTQSSDFTLSLIETARGEVGVKEVPIGSNAGGRVESYLRSVNLSRGNPWCMAFVYWCFAKTADTTGKKNIVPQTGHVRTAWNLSRTSGGATTVITAAEALENPSLVKPGMVFFIAWSSKEGHCGIVIDNINGDLETIEGNTNDDGHREGNGVFRRTKRKVKAINLGFAAYA